MVRSSPSRMALLVSVTQTALQALFAVLSLDGAQTNQNGVFVLPASTTAEVSLILKMKGRKSSLID